MPQRDGAFQSIARDLLLLGHDDLLRQPPDLRVALVAKRRYGHVDRTLMVRHHLGHEVHVESPVGFTAIFFIIFVTATAFSAKNGPSFVASGSGVASYRCPQSTVTHRPKKEDRCSNNR
jgi:hypothetical protein